MDKFKIPTLLLALISIELTHGQNLGTHSDLRISLMVSRSMYLKPLAQEKNLTTDDLELHSQSNLPSLKYSYDSNSRTQTAEAESLPSKTPFLNQQGICALEFVSASIGMSLSVICTAVASMGVSDIDALNTISTTAVYTTNSMLFNAGLTSIMGGIFRQHGSWGRSAIGTGLGAIINSLVSLWYLKADEPPPAPYIFLVVSFVLPPTGAVIGYNMHRESK